MTKQYIAEHKNGRNHDPISATTPNSVWRELEAATFKTRDELRAEGWKVVLDDGVRPPRFRPAPPPPPENPLRLSESMTLPVDDDSNGVGVIGWVIGAAIVVILIALYFATRG